MSEQTSAPVPEAPEAAPALPITETVTVLTPESTPTEMPVAEVVAEPAVEVVEAVVEPEKPAEEKPALHTDTETLLETGLKPKEAAKTEEKPAVEGEKPAVEAVEKTVYEPFKLPEGLPVDEKMVAQFSDLIGPHKLDQETAQKLVDLHVGTMQEFQTALLAKQHSDFADMRKDWVKNIKQDEVLGGSGHLTALQAAARMRDLLVPEKYRAEFADMLRITGAGDHPALFRLLHNAARLFDEPAAPAMPARPVPDRGGSAKPTRAGAMYDHPSSVRAAGR